MRVPHLVNGLPPLIASTDFRRSASDHIFFSQLSLIAFTPDMDDVSRFAYRTPPSASSDLPLPVLPDVVLFLTKVIQAQSPKATARTSEYRHHHSQRRAVQLRVAVFSENYRAHFVKYFDDQFC